MLKTAGACLLLSLCPASMFGQEAGQVVELDPFTVHSSSGGGYAVDDTISAGRIRQNILQAPVTLQILSEDLIDDTGSIELADLMDYAASVAQKGDTDEQGDGFTARGFPALTLRNGMRLSSGGFYMDAVNASRVEIARGPTGVLYGVGSPGGVINVITKRPVFTDDIRGELEVAAGTDAWRETNLDLGGAYPGASGKFKTAYRFVGSYLEKDEDGIDALASSRTLLSPKIAVELYDRVLLNLEYERYRRDFIPEVIGFIENFRNQTGQEFMDSNGNGVQDPGENFGPRSLDPSFGGFGREAMFEMVYGRFNDQIRNAMLPGGGSAGWEGFEGENVQDTYQFDATFDLTDSITARLTYFDIDLKVDFTSAVNSFNFLAHGLRGESGSPNSPSLGGNLVQLRMERRDKRLQNEILKADLLYRYAFGNGLNGDMVLNFEDQKVSFVDAGSIQQNLRVDVSSRDPATAELIFPATAAGFNFPQPTLGAPSVSDVQSVSVFNMLHALDDRLHVNLGARLDDYELVTAGGAITGDETTFQVGAVYDLLAAEDATFSVFFNWSETILPVSNRGEPPLRDLNGDGILDPVRSEAPVLPPETGDGWDVGLKFALFDNKVRGTVAYFDITRQNIARYVNEFFDLDGDGDSQDELPIDFYISSGMEEATGVDLELVWTPADDWQVVFSGSSFNGKVLSDVEDPRNVGRGLAGASELTYSLLLKRRFENGLTIGGGYTFQEGQDDTDPRFNDRFMRTGDLEEVDLFASYAFRMGRGNYVARLAMTNVADEDGLRSRGEALEPFRARLSLATKF